MRQRVARSPLLFLLVLASTGAQAAQHEGVVVSRLEAKVGVSGEEIDSLSGLLCGEVEKHATGRVISDADVQALLKADERKRLCSGEETSCLAEIGGALGVPEVVSGDVGRVGLVWIVNLRRIDVTKAMVLRRVTRQVKGDVSEVVAAIPAAVAALYSAVEPDAASTAVAPATPAASAAAIPLLRAGPAQAIPAGSTSGWRWLRWPALTAGAAGLVLGGVATWQAGSAADDYRKGAAGARDALSRRDHWTTISRVAYAGGGSLVVTGVALWLLLPPAQGNGGGDGPATGMNLFPVPGGALLCFRGMLP